jgi:microcystin-dependent protein
MEGTMATILLFAGNFAPRNWGFCDGSIIAIQSNTALFSLLGTTYGGNGTTTFALPDLRGRVAVGTGNGPGLSGYQLGQVGGSETVTLNVNNIPAHSHAVRVPTTDGAATSDDPNGNILALQGSSVYAAANTATGSYGGVTDSLVGGSQPISILQPYLALNYVICMYGIYPSRN